MEEEKPIKRIQLFAKLNRLSIKEFERRAGLNPNVIQNAIARNSCMSDDTLRKVLHTYPQLNMNWVLLGQGEMLMTPGMVVGKACKLEKEPSSKEVLGLINKISDNSLAPELRDKMFQLYQANSGLKSELLRIYQMIGNW